MYFYLISELLMYVVSVSAIIFIIVKSGLLKWTIKRAKKLSKQVWLAVAVLCGALIFGFYATHPYPLHFAMPPMMHSHAPGNLPPSIPVPSAFKFLFQTNSFEKVDDIGADPNKVPAPIDRQNSETVNIDLTAKEVVGELTNGIEFNYWTYNGQAPGPMLRVREGDDVTISLTNDKSSLHEHNIDLHAVTGPGGGAAVTKVKPGETKKFQWKALNPGLYIYHCATANVSTHNSHGQYGLIMVDPKEGLPKVDKEFYVVQGELYTEGGLGKKGLALFDPQALLDGIPTYVTFNGKIETAPRMKAKVGDKIRIYVGNGGVNLISSFHVIGEIFDTVYPEAAIGEGSAIHKNVQTTAVLPGGASIVEFTVDVPGDYLLVDHALARMNKGAWAVLKVEGEKNPEIFKSL